MDERKLHEILGQDLEVPEMVNKKLQETYALVAQKQAPAKRRGFRPLRTVLIAAAAAALLCGTAAAVVLPGLNRQVLDYFDVDPTDTQAVAQAENLLLPGAMALDITKEDNGATLHVTQILRDRDTVMILGEFSAPEGTQLYMGEADPPGVSTFKGFANGSGEAADFLDQTGKPMGKDGMLASYVCEVIEDSDPLDNRVSLMFTLTPQMGENTAAWGAAFLRVPAVDLAYYDLEQQREITVYAGDWSFEAPLPQEEIGWTVELDQAIGELDGAVLTAEKLYLSPITFELTMKREGGVDFSASLDEAGEAAYGRWMSIGYNVKRITLTTGDGERVPLELHSGGGGIGFNEKVVIHRLSQITDPAKFQGGTLTLEWDFTHNSQEAGSVTIPLDGLMMG